MQSYAYVEILLLDNFLITLVLFFFSTAILTFKTNKFLMFLSAFFSSIINLGLPFFNLNGIVSVLFKLSLGFVLCFICCADKKFKEQVKFYVVFLFSTCLFGGIFFFVYYAILIQLNLTNMPIGFFALIIFLLGKITFKFVRKYLNPKLNEFYYVCEILVNNKKIKINAFLDTGNFLKDESNKKPIAIIELNALNQLLTKKQTETLLKQDFSKLELRDLHSIEYSTIEGKTKKLTVFMPDKFLISRNNEKMEVDCLIGVSLLPLFSNQNFQAIIGTEIAQGVK